MNYELIDILPSSDSIIGTIILYFQPVAFSVSTVHSAWHPLEKTISTVSYQREISDLLQSRTEIPICFVNSFDFWRSEMVATTNKSEISSPGDTVRLWEPFADSFARTN